MSMFRFFAVGLAVMAMTGLNPAAAQQQQPGQQPGGQTPGAENNQGERYEARRVTIGGGQGLTVKQTLIEMLRKANQAEIEIAQMAQQKVESQEVKQLAQTVIQDHQQLSQKLQQMSSESATQGRQGAQGQQQAAGSEKVPAAFLQVCNQTADNALEMTKEMLGNYQGQDFAMAFLGQQAVAHTMLLAQLKAIESTGPQELQPVAQQAISKVESHLQKTKQLAKKLEDQERLGQGQRSGGQGQRR